MARSAVGRQLSLEAFEALPEEKPYLEYVEAEVVQKPVPKRPHWRLQLEVGSRSLEYSRSAGGSAGTEPHVYFPVDGGTQVRVRDVAQWAPAKDEGDDQRSLPPTLAIEVRSARQSHYDQRAKCRFMATHGADVCWLVDPDTREVTVFDGDDERMQRGDAVLESSRLPGFRLPLPELFALLDG